MGATAAEKYLIATAQNRRNACIYPKDIEEVADGLGVGREDTLRNLLTSPFWILKFDAFGPEKVIREDLKDPARLIAASAGWREKAATSVRAYFILKNGNPWEGEAFTQVINNLPSDAEADRRRAKLLAEEEADCLGFFHPPEVKKGLWGRAKDGLKQVGKWGAVGYILSRVWVLLSTLLKIGAKGKSLWSMLLSIGVYAWYWGLPFAVGFVGVLFIHEMGHVYMVRRLGIKAGLPMFIPFVGALIALKEHPQNVWEEAKVGIGGPLLGTIGALVVLDLGIWLESDLLFAVAYVGFMINLFNMLPLHPMDGGRILIAVSRWFLLVGLIGGLILFYFTHAPILLLILFVGLFGAMDNLKSEKRMTDEEKEKRRQYFGLSRRKKLGMGVAYLALLAVIVMGMLASHVDPETLEDVTEGGMKAPVEEELD